MSPRGRRLAFVLAGLVALLFAGRWTSHLLADRWWAATVSPVAVTFLTDWHLLRLTLNLSAVVVASAWFIGHLLVVYRAVGSVQIRRNVANLEFREALTPGILLLATVLTGASLGFLTGWGASRWTREVALAWQGVTYGSLDPFLQKDVGLFVGQLPIWRAAHGFGFLLVVVATGVVFGLYLLVGAIRWLDGRPAINTHARTHMGWLVAGLALILMWGYLLEPYELVAGLHDLPDRARWRATSLVSPVIAGIALATAVLSVAWAVRARHALAAAGWVVLALGSLAGRWLVPSLLREIEVPEGERAAIERLTQVAYGLEALPELPQGPLGQPTPPPVLSLWDSTSVTRLFAGDSVDVVAVNPAIVTIQGRPRPVWLATRGLPDGRLLVSAVADDRVGRAGEALFYQGRDSAARLRALPLLELPEGSFHPGAPSYRVDGAGTSGIVLGSWPKRALIAWALQAGGILRRLPADTRVEWLLSPADRLRRLAPFAAWGTPVARLVDGTLLWLVDGYLAAETFPLSLRLSWRGRTVGSLRAGFLGTVDAQSGATHIYLRPGADQLSQAWSAIAAGVIEPASAIPETVASITPYPLDLLRLQAGVLELALAREGRGSLPRDLLQPQREPSPVVGWTDQTTGPIYGVAFDRPASRRVRALLLADPEVGPDRLRLVRFDSAATLPSRGVLESSWNRFPSYEALTDSIREEGARLERGPVRVVVGPGGAVAYQTHFAQRADDGVSLAWVSVATSDRLGAGHTAAEAWSNLLGASVPPIPGAAQASRLEVARRLLLRADSALRAAAWQTFGLTWDSLRSALGLTQDSGAP